MLVVVLHDVYSSVKLSEAVDVILEFGEVDLFVVSKAVSAAAQSGVPEAEKRIFQRGRRMLFVPDLKDLFEILPISRRYFFVPSRLSADRFDPARVSEELGKGSVALVFSGGEASFSKKELELGTPVTLGFGSVMPPAVEMGIALYSLFPRRGEA